MKLLLCLLTLISFNAASQVYTWINEEGTRMYGDEAPAHAKKATLPKIQTLRPLKMPAPKNITDSANAKPVFPGYRQLTIISPRAEHTITAGKTGSVSIQLQIYPELQTNHDIRILLNGKAMMKGPQLQFELNGIERGSHLIQAQIRHKGKLLITSPKRRIHVQRSSIFNRSSKR